MAGPLNLGDLCIEIHVNILSLLRPRDVVAASQVCKSLHDAAKVRSVWLKVTRLMMEEQEILPDTYPLEALGTKTLRHIATSPARFSNLLKKHHDSQLLPKSSSVLLGPREQAALLGMTVRAEVKHFPHLLPGGRFLFLLLEGSVNGTGLEDKACVQLWDLGPPGTPSHFTLVASSILEDNYISWEVLPDSERSVYHFMAQNSEIDIYKLNLNEPLHFATPMNQLASDGEIMDFSCWKDRIAWVTDRCQVLVWDFKKRSAISWEVEPYFVVDEERMLLHLVEEDVYIVQKGCVFQWNIHELQDQDLLTSYGIRHPISTISHLFHSPQALSRAPDIHDLTFFSSQRSFLGNFSESHLAIIDQHQNCGFYRILPISHCTANTTGAPSTLLVHRGGHFLSIKPVDKYGLSDMQKCDESFVFTFNEEDGNQPVVIRVAEDGASAGSITAAEVRLALGFVESYTFHRLCTTTGRMVVVTGSDDTHIFIVDYLQES